MTLATAPCHSGRAVVPARLAEFRRLRGHEFCLDSLGFPAPSRVPHSGVDVVFRTARPNLPLTVQLKTALEQAMGRPVDVERLRDALNPRLKSRIDREAIYVCPGAPQ